MRKIKSHSLQNPRRVGRLEACGDFDRPPPRRGGLGERRGGSGRGRGGLGVLEMAKVTRDCERRVPSRVMAGRARYIEGGAGEAQGTRTFPGCLVRTEDGRAPHEQIIVAVRAGAAAVRGFRFNRLEVRLQPQHRRRLLVRRPRHHARRSKSTDSRETLTSQAPRRCREGQPPRVGARRARLLNHERSKSSSDGERGRGVRRCGVRGTCRAYRVERTDRVGTRKPDSDFPAKEIAVVSASSSHGIAP